MTRTENDCVGYPDGLPCMGNSCPNRNIVHHYCDKCGDEVSTLYVFDGVEYCEECLAREAELERMRREK